MTFPLVRAAQPSRRRISAYALAFGLGVHLLLLALVLLARVQEAPVEPRAIEVELIPFIGDQARRPPSLAAPRVAPAPAAVRPATETPPAPAQAPMPAGGDGNAPAAPAGRGISTGAPTVFPPGPSAGGVLRRTVGCTHADYLKLSPVEKAACDRQFAADRPKAQEIAKAVDAAMDPANGTDDFARAGRQNQAKRKYMEAPGADGYTSLRCNLLGMC